MIVVTGASRGLGSAIAERLTRLGKHVVGIARSGCGGEFESFQLDVGSADEVKRFATSLRSRKTDVNVLINAAGVASMNLALMAPPRAVAKVVSTNLLGTIYMCQAVAPLIIRSGGGSIINFSTIAVPLALRGESAYVASKAGVESYSRSLARELGDHKIQVNCISPGPINTDLMRGVSEEQKFSIISQQILQRQFFPSDVCDVVELLLDPRSRSISGHILHIGGV